MDYSALGHALSVISGEKCMGAGVRRPLHSVRSGIVWPSGIARGNLVLRNPEGTGPSGIARDPL